MTPESIMPWLALALAAIALLGHVKGFFGTEAKKNTEAVEALKKTTDIQGARLRDVESELKHLPSKDDVVELKLALAKLEGTVGRLDESLGSVQRTVQRIDTYLRKDA